MIYDFQSADTPDQIQADVCCIGAGPAGISLALKLDEKNVSVALIESGGDYPNNDNQTLYAGENIGLPYFPLVACRLRALGGSTGHWSGWCGPFNPIDFEKRSWIPNSGWPINYSDIALFYEEAQKLFKLGPFDYSSDFWSKEYQNFPEFEKSNLLARFFQFSTPPLNFGVEYKQLLENSKNISVYQNANALNIDLSEGSKSVDSIQLSTLGGKTGVVKAKHFVLACGGIENARLMLASTHQDNVGVGNGNDLVGRYFMEHVEAESAEIRGFDAQIMRDLKRKTSSEGTDIGVALCSSPEAQATLEIGNGASFLAAPSLAYKNDGWTALLSIKESLVQKKLPPNLFKTLSQVVQDFDTAVGVIALKAQGKLVPSRITNKGKLNLISLSEQTPNPESRVVLSDKLDRFGKPLANLDWQLSEIDHRTIRSTMLLTAAEMKRLDLGALQLKKWLEEKDNIEWPDFLRGGNHHMGTTRMSADPKQGVVDKNARVHGLGNLFIAGSSTFSTGGYINPTLSIVALSLRLAEHLTAIDTASDD